MAMGKYFIQITTHIKVNLKETKNMEKEYTMYIRVGLFFRVIGNRI